MRAAVKPEYIFRCAVSLTNLALTLCMGYISPRITSKLAIFVIFQPSKLNEPLGERLGDSSYFSGIILVYCG
jgi:hypothetical protein